MDQTEKSEDMHRFIDMSWVVTSLPLPAATSRIEDAMDGGTDLGSQLPTFRNKSHTCLSSSVSARKVILHFILVHDRKARSTVWVDFVWENGFHGRNWNAPHVEMTTRNAGAGWKSRTIGLALDANT